MPKAAGWPVAGGKTPLRLQEAVAACIGGCLLFLEGPVEQQNTAPLGGTKFEKVNDQLNKV